MKPFVFIFCSLLSFRAWSAGSYSFEQVIGMSDLIVTGEVEDIQENTFTFRINQTLKGRVLSSITVLKNYECDRYSMYSKGQRMCLFLRKGLMSWTIVDGNTGERPILDETVFLGVDGNYKLSLREFSDGISEFCNTYTTRVTTNGYSFRQKVYFIQEVSEDQLNVYRNKNKFNRWLCSQITYDELTVADGLHL